MLMGPEQLPSGMLAWSWHQSLGQSLNSAL
jgi:hypothetical protein